MSRTAGIGDDSVHAPRRHFASDNYAGICPEAWDALQAANQGHAASYGEDGFTRRAEQAVRDFFETECWPFFLFNGTAANALSVSTLCRSYQAVICHQWSHLATDECGAAECFSGGAKLLPIAGEMGKLDPLDVQQRIGARTDVHFSQVRAVSLTQATEVGTIYTADEIRQVAQLAHDHDLWVHMDGARFANALAHCEMSPKDLSWTLGVDALSLGGTKNGLPVGDVVVFFRRELAQEFQYRRKQAGQLASKMRFVTAPWAAVLESGAYLDHARHANAMAQRLRQRLTAIPGLAIVFPTQANSVFVEFETAVRDGLHRAGWKFYSLLGDNICRLMCSWDTTVSDIDQFCDDVAGLLAKNASRPQSDEG